MEQVTVDNVEIDRCRHCQGLWFDSGELVSLADSAAIAALDTGDAASGKAYDKLREYDCPRCSGDMESVTDALRPHIRFETCRDCGGSFLDAGELRDRIEPA